MTRGIHCTCTNDPQHCGCLRWAVQTPTNDNATAGVDPDLIELAKDEIIALLQARVAEVEADYRRVYTEACELRHKHKAALSREKEAKAEGLREAAEEVLHYGSVTEWPADLSPADLANDLRAIADRALAQSGGADTAQGKGDE